MLERLTFTSIRAAGFTAIARHFQLIEPGAITPAIHDVRRGAQEAGVQSGRRRRRGRRPAAVGWTDGGSGCFLALQRTWPQSPSAVRGMPKPDGTAALCVWALPSVAAVAPTSCSTSACLAGRSGRRRPPSSLPRSPRPPSGVRQFLLHPDRSM